MIGTAEIAIIAGVGILLFGAKKLPELGKSVAEGIQEFKKASRNSNLESETYNSNEEK